MGRGFSVPYRFQSLLVAFHCLCLAASTLGRGVPHHRTQDPKKPGVLRRRSLGIFPQLPGLSYQLLNSCASRILLPHGIREKAHARQYPDLGIDEIRILLRRSSNSSTACFRSSCNSVGSTLSLNPLIALRQRANPRQYCTRVASSLFSAKGASCP